jgi:hypothetical protein
VKSVPRAGTAYLRGTAGWVCKLRGQNKECMSVDVPGSLRGRAGSGGMAAAALLS